LRDSNFELSIVAEAGMLFVVLQVPPHAQEQEIATAKSRIATAFALIENVAEDALQSLQWEKHSSNDADRYLLSRPYSDPAYPTRFASALQFFAPDAAPARRH
jgi:hypothetical protein